MRDLFNLQSLFFIIYKNNFNKHQSERLFDILSKLFFNNKTG